MWVDILEKRRYYRAVPKIGKQRLERGVNVLVNANLLKGKIVAAGYNQQTFATVVQMSANSLNAKINGRKKFDTEEVSRICKALGIIDPDEKCNIFLS